MCDRSVTMLNMELDTQVSKLFVIKLPIIVNDDAPRETELRDDGLPDKFPSFGLDDLGHRLGFHPFGEVVNSYEQES